MDGCQCWLLQHSIIALRSRNLPPVLCLGQLSVRSAAAAASLCTTGRRVATELEGSDKPVKYEMTAVNECRTYSFASACHFDSARIHTKKDSTVQLTLQKFVH